MVTGRLLGKGYVHHLLRDRSGRGTCHGHTNHDHDRRILFSVSDVVCHVSISASIFLTLAITKERHSAITSPISYQIRAQTTPRSR